MEIKIIYEDDDVVVIDKPAGLVVNRAESVKGETLQDWMDSKLKTKIGDLTTENPDDVDLFRKRSGLVHRLDRDTSGVMVLAKNPKAMLELMRQFHDRETEKTYWALVHAKFKASSGNFSAPLARSRHNRKRFEVSLGGRMTETGYKVINTYEHKDYDDGFAIVELYPKTGRTHQLRVILKHLSHPIVGDWHYLGRKRAKADAKWCGRQFLHARKLCFNLPSNNERVCFESQLSPDLETSLLHLKLAN